MRLVKQKLYHNYLFLFGFIYYLVVPVIVGENNLFTDFPGMQLFYEYYPTGKNMCRYILLIALIFIGFYMGSFSALLMQKNVCMHSKQLSYASCLRSNKWIIFLLAVIDQILIISNRNILFMGYTIEYNPSLLGKLATLNSFFLFLYLYGRQKNKKQDLFLLFLLLENSIVLIGFGSRMFVLIPVISFLIYAIDNIKIKIKKLAIYIILFTSLFVLVGLFRDGSDNSLTFELVSFGFLAEPIFTWISAGSFITLNNFINPIEFPTNFMGTIVNIIPSFLLPNKADFIEPIPYEYDNPLGAMNIVAFLYGNFGLFISPFIALLFGFFLTHIRFKKSSFFKVYYYCICSIIPFLFFRDTQSFNKLLFSAFLLFPSLIICCRFINFNRLFCKNNRL